MIKKAISILRDLPSVDELLRSDGLKEESRVYGFSMVRYAVRKTLDGFRNGIKQGMLHGFTQDDVVSGVKKHLKRLGQPTVKEVINASGTILHTNLGRGELSREAIEALVISASKPVNLEFDLKEGLRWERDFHAEELLMVLTGAEAACIVNNNAAAVLITLNTLAEGKEVLVSRGELIEIGGSFRLPEIIEKSGCILKEVGTTNRTHPNDYTSNINPSTAALFKAHKSNYWIGGFTSEVTLKELVNMGRAYNLPVVEDLGSGSLIDLSVFGLKKEPVVGESIIEGADIVTFSADKLLGGPQAGIIAGKKGFIDRVKKNPLKRALRVDKLTISALSATLRLYLNPDALKQKLPILRHILRPIEDIETTALKAKALLGKRLGGDYIIDVTDGESIVGSGSLPGYNIGTKLLTITHPTIGVEEIFERFLGNTPPILGRIHREKFILDARTIEKAEDICPL